MHLHESILFRDHCQITTDRVLLGEVPLLHLDPEDEVAQVARQPFPLLLGLLQSFSAGAHSVRDRLVGAGISTEVCARSHAYSKDDSFASMHLKLRRKRCRITSN